MADRIGQQLGNYRLTRLLGQGGFAEVYLGVHVHLGTEVAIKLLHTQLASASEIEKFRAEAQTIVTLNHPNIVRILDFGVEAGIPYLIMDYAPNGSLRQRLPADTPLPAATILPYLIQVAAALQYAHEQKLVHRDVKPENMLLGRNQEVLLTDFGIAIVAQNTSIQKTQGVAGTAAYMAPEQLQGKPRPSSDLYSLGVVVYEWLCGERPFQGGPLEVISQHVLTPPPPLREKVPGIPPAIEQVVLTALAKDPKERFGNVRAFANAFQQACRDAGMVYVTSTQPIAPPAPASLPPPPLSQASTMLSKAPTQTGTPPGGQPDQAGASIFSATTHLTPQLTPPVPTPSSPAGQVGQAGPSLFSAQTQLTPAQGWAAPVPPSEPGATLVTSEAAYRAGGPAYRNDQYSPPGVPVAPGAPAPDVGRGHRKGGWRRWTLVAVTCLLVLALVGGAAAYGLSHLPHTPSTASTGATVTITPAKSDLSNTFTLTAVTGTPDASKQQVGARTVSATTQPYTKTVNATGQGTTPGTQAVGTADVYNGYSSGGPTLNYATGTTFPNNTGCAASSFTMVLDAPVSVPPGMDGSVPAHVQQVGPVKDPNNPTCSPLLAYQEYSCGGGPCIQVVMGVTTDGTNPQTQTAVAQSDIDNAANMLISQNQPNPQQVLQPQLQSNEQPAGTPQCTPKTTSDHQAGDAATTVTVTVTFTCTGEAYDHDGALALAAKLLMDQAANTPGAGYALVGQIKTNLVPGTPDSQGTVAIAASAEGIWAYQFSASQQQALANLIAGKSKQDAMSLLLAQTGVAQVSIAIAGGNGQTLPTDAKQITITVQAVSGL